MKEKGFIELFVNSEITNYFRLDKALIARWTETIRLKSIEPVNLIISISIYFTP